MQYSIQKPSEAQPNNGLAFPLCWRRMKFTIIPGSHETSEPFPIADTWREEMNTQLVESPTEFMEPSLLLSKLTTHYASYYSIIYAPYIVSGREANQLVAWRNRPMLRIYYLLPHGSLKA